MKREMRQGKTRKEKKHGRKSRKGKRQKGLEIHTLHKQKAQKRL